ncbi:MAG: tyrosine-type recombinase/integrase [Nitrososphaeraceae archaeon]
MRDLYHRKEKLEYWIQRVETDLIDESDRLDVLQLVEHMQDKERSILWIIRCITALITIRKQIGKPFGEVRKEDIKSFLRWMEQEKKYKASTNEKFRQILKLFYKTVYGGGNNDNNTNYHDDEDKKEYPECVRWFSVKLGKEKTGKDTVMNMSEYLEEEEIQKLIEYAPTLQKKAFLACLYESGARPEEFLRITNKDFRIDKNGVVLMLRGKTGERRVRIVAFAKLMQQWLDLHPLKDQSYYPLWISESTNCKNNALGIRGAQKIIEETLPKTKLENKHARLYILRHSRATHLAKHLTEAQMCTYFGWVQGTQVVRRYIHLSGKDIDDKLLSLSKEGNLNLQQQKEDFKLKVINCKRCSENISVGTSFCSRCGLSVKIADQYITDETEIEQENKELKLQVKSIVCEVSNMRKQMQDFIYAINSMDQHTKNRFAKQMVKTGLFK